MITLRAIDETNSAACAALRVAPDQETFIATNAQSLARAQQDATCTALGIYQDAQIVGFLLCEPRGNAVFSVHRFMVDAQYQRQGIGHRAMEQCIESIRQMGGITIYLSFRPENEAAKALYAKLGFVEHEIEPDGEVVYRLGPQRLF